MPKSRQSKEQSDILHRVLEGQLRLENKLDLHIQKTEYEFKEIRKLDDAQNALLAQHAQRSEEIKRDNELREAQMRQEIFGTHKGSVVSRVTKLEIPQKWLDHTKSLLLWLAAVAGAWTAIKAIL